MLDCVGQTSDYMVRKSAYFVYLFVSTASGGLRSKEMDVLGTLVDEKWFANWESIGPPSDFEAAAPSSVLAVDNLVCLPCADSSAPLSLRNAMPRRPPPPFFVHPCVSSSKLVDCSYC